MHKFNYWHWPIHQVLDHFKSHKDGLSTKEAARRLKRYGRNSLKPPKRGKGITLFIDQFKSPIILLLIGAALLSAFVGGRIDTLIIFSIVLLSGLLGFFQERGALNTIDKLMQLVENKATVLRDGKEKEIPLEEIVPGDILQLRAGDLVPADCILIDVNLFYVDEATLTGESAPVEKKTGLLPIDTSLLKRTNAIFLGTTVSSGIATALVVATGQNTEFSLIADKIRFRPPETSFEIGLRRFGFFLLEVTLILVIAIFAINTYFHKPVIESFLFSLALAVGLTPQLLPVIISVNLSHGACQMAKNKVIIKRLASLENFGQMDVLCTDKTGTITLGKMRLDKAVDFEGNPNEKTALYGFLNAHFQTGYSNPIDQALSQSISFDVSNWKKIGEIPYDFIRKRLSVFFENSHGKLLITKGAVPEILSICKKVELHNGSLKPLSECKAVIDQYFETQNQQGFRTLGIAYGSAEQETDLTFLGFLHFFDPIKPDIVATVAELKKKGVDLKIITGDYHSVAAHVARLLDISPTSIITGKEIHKISDSALLKIASEKQIFAEIEPNQKERIILALRKSGHVVGYLGDGLNDVAALHSADVGIAVDSGADAAKESADIVLLAKDLNVLRKGIEEGRRTFINTLKYVYMASSANFGNMFSMAGVSLFLKFLPLLPTQVLLTNFLSDFPEMALATDNVDDEIVRTPVKWDLTFIRRFMIVFGLLSSVCDYLTFGILLFWLRSDTILFRSGWFVESVVSATLIVLAIRTRGPLWRSKPGKLLLFSVLSIVLITLLIPYTSLGELFEFTPLPPIFLIALAGIIVFYIASVEIAKHFFYSKVLKHHHKKRNRFLMNEN